MYRNDLENNALKTGTRIEGCMYFPSFLLEMPLSMTERIAYVLILNRTLFGKERLKNESGELYCSYPTKELAEHLDRGRTATREAVDRLCFYGLIRKGFYSYNTDGIYYPLIPRSTIYSRHLDPTAGYLVVKDKQPEE